MEKADDNMPTVSNNTTLVNFFTALNDNLDIEGYACKDNLITEDDGIVRTSDDIKVGITWRGQHYGDDSESFDCGTGDKAPWIITSDGMAYTLAKGFATDTCKTKGYANSRTTYDDYKDCSCLVAAVDINGLIKGPNKLDPQYYKTFTVNEKLKKLTGDRYLLYIMSDGIAKGNPTYILTGRILAGEK